MGNLQAGCQARNTASAPSACSTRAKGGQEGTRRMLEGGKRGVERGKELREARQQPPRQHHKAHCSPISNRATAPKFHVAAHIQTSAWTPNSTGLVCNTTTYFTILQKRSKTGGSPHPEAAFPVSLLISGANKMPYFFAHKYTKGFFLLRKVEIKGFGLCPAGFEPAPCSGGK